MPHPKYISFDPPNDKSPDPEVWAQAIMPDVLALGRNTIALFKNFPPEYVDYYKALQVEIAKIRPEEQDRPLICLDIIGNKRKGEKSPADVGMAGGTGPLSDATALENLVRRMGKVGETPWNKGTRETIAENMANFSGVMYSMPPPRDVKHAHDGTSYLSLYKSARRDIPCTSLHILTNTGHSNKSYFGNDYLLGKKKFGDVDDMTIKVAHRIKVSSETRPPGERVLVLGTTDAAKKKLYPNLLDNRNLESVLPTGVVEGLEPRTYFQRIVSQAKRVFQGEEAQTYLQTIINQAKAGKINDPMPNEERTCGQAFVDFAVQFARANQCTSLLFSCTEIPMLLHTKVPPDNEQTYYDLLKKELPKNIAYFDTEDIFVDEIVKKSEDLQKHPEIRSTASLRGGGLSHYHVLHAKLDEVKESMLKHCHSFMDLKDDLQKQKRNVLLATLQFFEDGDKKALQAVIAENPRYADATLRSTTLALVSKGIRLAEEINDAKSKMNSFKTLKEDLNKGRAQERAEANAMQFDESKEPYDDQAQSVYG